MTPKNIFLFAGEASGDDHGSKLLCELKQKFPDATFTGVGGPKMRREGLNIILSMEAFEVMGFFDVLIALPRLVRNYFKVRNALLKIQPDIILTIDYAECSLALHKSLNRRGYSGQQCHYISPSVWAWRKGRIRTIEKILDRLFVIFPFETPLFDGEKISVDYVGHPLVNAITEDRVSPLSINSSQTVVGLFPGSRTKEIFRNFPIQLAAAKMLLQDHPSLQFVVSVSQSKFSPILDQLLKKSKLDPEQVLFLDSTHNRSLMKRCDLALAKSGTNNLELALHQVPTVVTYGIGLPDLILAKYILRIRLPHYCIVNILSHEEVFPELFGPNLTKKNLYKAANHFLNSPKAQSTCREKCTTLGILLGKKNPEQEIASLLGNTE